MASDESMTALSSVHSSMHDFDVDGYLPHGFTDADEVEEDESVVREGENDHMDIIQMSRLSLESTWEGDGDGDADNNTHLSDHADDDGGASGCDDEDDGGGGVTWASTNNRSLPGTPTGCARRRAGSTKEYASESEASRRRHGDRARRKSCGGARGRSSSYSSYHHRRTRRTRQRQLDLAWEMKRCHRGGDGGGAPDTTSGSSSPCVVVRTTGPGAGCMWMDMEEVKACRDLGLELPCNWTVEIPPSALTAVAATDAASGSDSPVGSWRVSSPGEDPGEMRARLRVWAQAVALTCLPPEQLS
ncbi:hypothetical protein Taro_034370 [Colocasia esculenta]|uniref:Uncharacterized protein n=1 Tax=Colocasia esculenta TaxID=4460 RepID=A0A843VR55_COLES|nr:hypothetical protein [Colocasia esculenta]